jgi:hypothetical protein
MKINVSIDIENLKTRTQREVKNLAYSTAQALNDTAKDVQYRIQGDVQKIFHLRRGKSALPGSDFSRETGDQPSRSERSFIVRAIKVLAWANVMKGRIYAEVGINNRPRLLLAKFEKGDIREPFVGKRVAVPISETARKGSVSSVVDPKLTFKRLGFKKYTTKTGKRQIKGKMRTFILSKTAAHPMGGVYQRVGPRREDIQMVYSFKRAFRLRAVLRFIERARETYIKRFRENFLTRFYHLQR